MLIVRRAGKAIRVLGGSTSFALRGLYIQANNVLLFDDENVAGKCAGVFDAYRTAPATLRKHPLSPQCWEVRDQPGSKVSLCFAPHADGALSLNPIATSIGQTSSSVLYSIVFLSQINGKVRDAQDRRGACIQALRLLDHFHFRVNAGQPCVLHALRLAKPPAAGRTPGSMPAIAPAM